MWSHAQLIDSASTQMQADSFWKADLMTSVREFKRKRPHNEARIEPHKHSLSCGFIPLNLLSHYFRFKKIFTEPLRLPTIHFSCILICSCASVKICFVLKNWADAVCVFNTEVGPSSEEWIGCYLQSPRGRCADGKKKKKKSFVSKQHRCDWSQNEWIFITTPF